MSVIEFRESSRSSISIISIIKSRKEKNDVEEGNESVHHQEWVSESKSWKNEEQNINVM